MRQRHRTLRWQEIMAGQWAEPFRMLDGVGAVEVTDFDLRRAQELGDDPAVELLRTGKLADGLHRWTIVALVRRGTATVAE